MPKLHNIHSAEVLRKQHFVAQLDRTTLSFYRYVRLNELNLLRDSLYTEWEAFDVLGRIYLAHEGVNAQLSVPTSNLDDFKRKLYAREEFDQVAFKIAVEDDGKSFLKLTIKVRPKLVADGLPDDAFDTSNVGTHLNAVEFNAAMERGATVVDMRNDYECAIGHFAGAVLPNSTTFRAVMPEMRQKLKGKEQEEVLLYCTGGIRCEKASAWLRHNGFTNVGQLHGGIIDYARQVQAAGLQNNYRGQNFVFDERLAERITEDVVGECQQCAKPSDRITNCGNVLCNVLLVQCEACKAAFHNCCTPKCQQIAALPEDQQRELRKGHPGRPTDDKFIRNPAALRACIDEENALLAAGYSLLTNPAERMASS